MPQMFMLIAVQKARGTGSRGRSSQVVLGVCEETLCNEFLKSLVQDFDRRLAGIDHVEAVAVPSTGMTDFDEIIDRYTIPLY